MEDCITIYLLLYKYIYCYTIYLFITINYNRIFYSFIIYAEKIGEIGRLDLKMTPPHFLSLLLSYR